MNKKEMQDLKMAKDVLYEISKRKYFFSGKPTKEAILCANTLRSINKGPKIVRIKGFSIN